MTYQDALKLRARMAYGQVKTAAGDKAQNDAYNAALQDEYNRKSQEMLALAQHDQNIADTRGFNQVQESKNHIIPGTKPAEKAQVLSKINEDSLNNPNGPTRRSAAPDAEGLADLNNAVDSYYRNGNLIGAGIGAGVGLGVGAGAYGLAGLFPSLKKRRLLRALIALGAGAAAGTGAGIGAAKIVNKRTA